MKHTSIIALFFLLGCVSSMVITPEYKLKVPIPKDSPLVEGFRPPAVPLVVMDPFMSIWSFADNLSDTFPTLWCGVIKALVGAIRIDGKAYRFMGPNNGGIPIDDVISQTSVVVQPTQTIYTFETDEIILEVRFTTATIPTDLDLLSQPVTYITFTVSSKDGQSHQIELYYDQTAEIAISTTDEQVGWSRVNSPAGGPTYIMQMGTTAQNVLGKSGDCDGINWGYAYVGVSPVDSNDNVATVIAGSVEVRTSFANNGNIPSQDDTRQPRAASDDWPVMAVAWSFQVGASESQSRYLIFAYDDIASIDYFGAQLPAYWRRNNQTILGALVNATTEYEQRIAVCDQFDEEFLDNVLAVSNANYTTLASLAYRQTFGGCKLVWNAAKNAPWYFMKEISSDGDLQTVDVIFPASPLFFYTNPYLVELMLLPLLAYANNETNIPYNLSWAPHHLGTYPIGNLSPNQQEQMPVEETGNLLMLMAALNSYSHKQGKDYQSLIFPTYQNMSDSWANYLLSGAGVLPDPGDQLCTDDFLGPSPHNVNLALKGIVGLGVYAHLCTMMGRLVPALKYTTNAKQFSQYWMANANDTDHYRLQYDLPNTSSLKYNMLYQYVVGTSTFPDSVMEAELNYYMTKALNEFGVPLNSAVTFTKLDWLSWIAAMAPNTSDGLELINRIYNFANTTPNRVPLTDWYDTVKGTQNGFQARTVVGGMYAWMLLKSSDTYDHYDFSIIS